MDRRIAVSARGCRWLLLSLLLGVWGCKPQPSPEVRVKRKADTAAASERERLLAELEAERALATQRAQEIEADIRRLEEELATSTELSEAEKNRLAEELAAAEQARQTEMAKLGELERQQDELSDELKQSEAENQRLEAELEQKNAADAPIVQRIADRVFFYKSDCIDVSLQSTAEGANTIAYPCANRSNQVFTLELLESKYFRMIASHSGKCLYVANASIEDGANIEQRSCKRNGDSSELFRFYDKVGEYDFKIQNLRSGKCFKIQTDGNLIQDDCAVRYTLFRWGSIE